MIPTLFTAARDAEILRLWLAGANLDQIAAAFSIDAMRACHEVNAVLNARTVGVDFSGRRE